MACRRGLSACHRAAGSRRTRRHARPGSLTETRARPGCSSRREIGLRRCTYLSRLPPGVVDRRGSCTCHFCCAARTAPERPSAAVEPAPRGVACLGDPSSPCCSCSASARPASGIGISHRDQNKRRPGAFQRAPENLYKQREFAEASAAFAESCIATFPDSPHNEVPLPRGVQRRCARAVYARRVAPKETVKAYDRVLQLAGASTRTTR